MVPFSLFNAHWLPRFTPLDFRSFWHFFHLSLITSKHSTALNTQNPNIFTTYTAATGSKPLLFFHLGYWNDLTLGLLMPSLRLVSVRIRHWYIWQNIQKNGILNETGVSFFHMWNSQARGSSGLVWCSMTSVTQVPIMLLHDEDFPHSLGWSLKLQP